MAVKLLRLDADSLLLLFCRYLIYSVWIYYIDLTDAFNAHDNERENGLELRLPVLAYTHNAVQGYIRASLDSMRIELHPRPHCL